MGKKKAKKPVHPLTKLSRREREIMEVVYRKGQVSCSDVRAELVEAPSYSAVRAMLNKLVDKEYLEIEADGKKYIYYPIVSADQVSEGAMSRLVETFFGGSVGGAIVALINNEQDTLDAEEIHEIEKLLKEKRKKAKSNRRTSGKG